MRERERDRERDRERERESGQVVIPSQLVVSKFSSKFNPFSRDGRENKTPTQTYVWRLTCTEAESNCIQNHHGVPASMCMA